jgi:hypothetical protein
MLPRSALLLCQCEQRRGAAAKVVQRAELVVMTFRPTSSTAAIAVVAPARVSPPGPPPEASSSTQRI